MCSVFYAPLDLLNRNKSKNHFDLKRKSIVSLALCVLNIFWIWSLAYEKKCYPKKCLTLSKLTIFFLWYSFFLFIYSHVHTVFGSFLPLVPGSHPLTPTRPCFQAELALPLSLILLKRRHKHYKEDKAFLLVKDSYAERFLALLPCTHVLQPRLIHL
jgi:hypothetical protein